MASIEVAVIIPTLNSSRNLRDAILSVQAQTGVTSEIIVVDGGSSDGTVGLAAGLGATVIRGSFGRSSARRAGVEKSSSRYLLFLDSDQVIDRGLLVECIQLARSRGLDAIRIPEEDRAFGFWLECRSLDRLLFSVESLTYPRFVTRTAYDQVGGHSIRLESFMEDRDLYRRIQSHGLTVGWSERRILNQMGRVSPLDLGKKGFRSSFDARAYYQGPDIARDSLASVVLPRIRRLLQPGILRRQRFRTLAVFPIYELTVYLPRFVSAGAARLSSGF